MSNLTICPRSSDPFYIASYYIKWVTTSWTHSIYFIFLLEATKKNNLDWGHDVSKVLKNQKTLSPLLDVRSAMRRSCSATTISVSM